MNLEIPLACRFWKNNGSDPREGLDAYGFVSAVYDHPVPRTFILATGDWAARMPGEPLLEEFHRWPNLTETSVSSQPLGAVLLFRMDLGAPALHCAVVSRPGYIAHAYWGKAATETRLNEWWKRRLAFAFSPLRN